MLLKIKNDINELTRVLEEVKTFCKSHNICDQKFHDITLILDEVITNIISYAYHDGMEHVFTLRAEKKRGCVSIKLVDDGIAFDPIKNSDPDVNVSVENRKIGGLGIFIVKQLSEAIEYSRVDNKNHLKIKVSIE